MIQVAMVGKWHVHAQGYAQFVQEQPDAQITCVWDEDAERGCAWAKELGADFEADYDALLQRSDVDAVLINTATSQHREKIVAAANAGKHIFTEKVLALTMKDCDAISEAVTRNGVQLAISYPHRCMPRNLFVKQAVEEGRLGRITLLRIRNCHDGALAGWLPEYWYDPATTGGGAMMDLGAHGMYLATWLLGQPRRIQSMFTNLTGHAVEDNAVCTMEFENGAIAITETSLVSPMTPVMLEVYGTDGVILCQDDDVKIRTREDGGAWVHPQLPEPLEHPIRQFLDGIQNHTPVLFGLSEACMLTQMMERAYISDAKRKEVQF